MLLGLPLTIKQLINLIIDQFWIYVAILYYVIRYWNLEELVLLD